MNSHSYTQRNGSALVCRPLHSCGNIRRLLTHNTFSQNEEGKGTAIPGRSKEEKELERRGGGGERRNWAATVGRPGHNPTSFGSTHLQAIDDSSWRA